MRNERAIWRSVLERDIDHLLLALLHTSEDFRDRMLRHCLEDHYQSAVSFNGAWHSVLDELGHESDLEAEWVLADGNTIRVLIEDKIDAACQPDQAIRYRARADRYRASGVCDLTKVVLVAPGQYRIGFPKDTEAFEVHLTFEDLKEWIDKVLPKAMSPYWSGLLTAGVIKLGRGRTSAGTREPGGAIHQLPGHYAVIEDELRLIQPTMWVASKSQNAWVYLQAESRAKSVKLRYRMTDHWAELAVNRNDWPRERLLEELRRVPLPSASISERGATEWAVWIPCPEVDVTADAESQRPAIRAGLAVAAELQRWQELTLYARQSSSERSDSI